MGGCIGGEGKGVVRGGVGRREKREGWQSDGDGEDVEKEREKAGMRRETGRRGRKGKQELTTEELTCSDTNVVITGTGQSFPST